MNVLAQNFERAYTLVQKNMEASGDNRRLPGQRAAFFMNTHTPGILDVGDLAEADRMEFLQMAHYGLLGVLPEQAVLERWQSKNELSDWEYRKAVLDSLMQNPEVAARGRVIRNNIYADADTGHEGAGRSMKQRFLSAGYQVSRRLPLSIKVPLKRLVMKLLMK